MLRSFEEEILDRQGLPPEMVERAHRALSRTHGMLGNHGAILLPRAGHILRVADNPPDGPGKHHGVTREQ